MLLTKFGHSCLLIEESGVRVLIDPGSYSTGQNEATGIDLILITHQHPDHCDLNSLRVVLANNPKAEAITNAGVAEVLAKDDIKTTILSAGTELNRNSLTIKALGEQHAVIYPTLSVVANSGYLIGDKFFHPGDSFTVPDQPVGAENFLSLLALPVAGPWLKLADAIDYAKTVKPKICLPVHDGNLKSAEATYRNLTLTLQGSGIGFVPLTEGQPFSC